MSHSFKRALISVSDKSHLVEFATKLHNLNIQIISTGGTAEYLKTHLIPVIEVANITHHKEMLDGRVKTLHPNIHGGILACRDNPEHMTEIKSHDIEPIDIVCVNLYPFEECISKPGVAFTDAVENIDIGGPAMIRSAAKNHKSVVVITHPSDYDGVIHDITTQGDVSYHTRLHLAQKAFNHTAYYDSIIANYLSTIDCNPPKLEDKITIPLTLINPLRYGENSHQMAWFYKDSNKRDGLMANCHQLHGKELSYNNIADGDTAWECVKSFTSHACAIVKHANPCGVALSDTIKNSYIKALASDPISSFGGIVAFNGEVDVDTAISLSQQFIEVLIAPRYTKTALEILQKKANIRILQINLTENMNTLDYKRIGGGMLIQTTENKLIHKEDLKLVTSHAPNIDQIRDMIFAWNVARFVKSNGIVLAKNEQVIGIGAGQTSRIDATKIALNKAHDFGFNIIGSVCASDAFFPFSDNIELLAKQGVGAIIQPGGSVKDEEVFSMAEKLNISMLLTNYRVFRH